MKTFHITATATIYKRVRAKNIKEAKAKMNKWIEDELIGEMDAAQQLFDYSIIELATSTLNTATSKLEIK